MDPIADMLIRIKNAQKAGKETVLIPYSKFKHEIAKALERAGICVIAGKRGKRVKKFLELELKGEAFPVTGVRFYSTPRMRQYSGYKDIRASRNGGFVFLTTPKGVMSSIEAKKEKVGGQLIAEIW